MDSTYALLLLALVEGAFLAWVVGRIVRANRVEPPKRSRVHSISARPWVRRAVRRVRISSRLT